MNPKIVSKLRDPKECEISILAVVTRKRSQELDRILSHTRWQIQTVSLISEARQILQTSPISVVLCEDRLADGNWSDLLPDIERLYPRPQIVVLSECADALLWGEVLNCGGYDLLAIPLEPKELYTVVPMAWRGYVRNAPTNASAKITRNSSHALALSR